ncbi:tripartite tricarboxylate transporter substrate binding protein [Rhodovulum sp. 12E13]|uniref:Bug family tripartite tricarboxylate transporter substrate binding protein n=1 Tax=Rhodovulum sp. 12E13 TaxID=2203891 RepID=UPI001314C5EE|nr:tripartite tricarboxylate transporter substrate binding protein [Rhodovulum sp. 12E13]
MNLKLDNLKTSLAGGAAGLTLTLALGVAAVPAAAADFPEAGSTITIVIPNSPGGSTDTSARLFADALSKNLPNQPNVVVQNRTGGNGMIALNDIMRADPDGYTLGILEATSVVLPPVLEGRDYDPLSLEWIAQINNPLYLAVASKASGLTSVEQMAGTGETFVQASTGGRLDGSTLGARMTGMAMGFDVNPIPHDGASEALLAVIRGDVDWMQGTFPTIYAQIDDVVPLFTYTSERIPNLPDVPSVAELGHEELLKLNGLQLVLGATPGTPDDVMATLNAAAEAAFMDETFQEGMVKANQNAEWLDAGETRELIQAKIDLFSAARDELLEE